MPPISNSLKHLHLLTINRGSAEKSFRELSEHLIIPIIKYKAYNLHEYFLDIYSASVWEFIEK